MTEYETATIQYDEDGPGLYSIMIVKMEEVDERPLTRLGYWNRGTVFLLLGSNFFTNKARAMARRVEAADDDHLMRLLSAVERGEVPLNHEAGIIDGEKLTPSDIRATVGE